MKKNNQISSTDKNLDRLSKFLESELKQPELGIQIPNRAHLFYGSYNDSTLTQDNIQLISKILIGMALGYVEEAPLVMMYEYSRDKKRIINLSDESEKIKTRTLIEKFQNQNRNEMMSKINELIPD
jgi:hypothetical protein